MQPAVREIAAALIDDLQSLRGIGPATAQLVRELVETGRCPLYDEVLADAGATADRSRL